MVKVNKKMFVITTDLGFYQKNVKKVLMFMTQFEPQLFVFCLLR